MLILSKLWVEKAPLNCSSCWLNHSPGGFQLFFRAWPSQSAEHPQEVPRDGDSTSRTGSTLSRRSRALPSCPTSSSALRARINSTNLPKNLQAHFPPQQSSPVWHLSWDQTLLWGSLLCVFYRGRVILYFFNVNAVTFPSSSWINQHFSSVGGQEKSAALLWLWINSCPERLCSPQGIAPINTENF